MFDGCASLAERGLPGRSAPQLDALENLLASAVFGAAAPRMGALRELTGRATSRRAALLQLVATGDRSRSILVAARRVI